MAKVQRNAVKEEETKQKDKYKIVNWSAYNKSLISRGDITVWLDEEVIAQWSYDGPAQRGAQFVYSDICITSLLNLKAVFTLGYRQLAGFAKSLLGLMGIEAQIPAYTQICRRAKDLDVKINVPKSKEKIYLVFDSTGLKVFGEGEWKVRKHGYNKRRTWRKLHLGVDESTGMIHAQVLTENGEQCSDAQQVEQMLEQVESEVDKVGADGAYDTFDVWTILKERGIEGIIPPQKNAVYWEDEQGNLLDLDRNKILEKIDEIGRAEWKKESGYHRRSLSETAMFRFKTIFGRKLFSRLKQTQNTEAAIKVNCLNIMTALGMPVSVKVSS